MKPRKIALFGGSFDPPHLGHIMMAQAAIHQAGVDEVIFIPCAVSPHKTSTPPTPGADRLAMLKLATKDLPWATVSDIDLNLPLPSYTWRTVEAVASHLPDGTQLHWILGADQWENLEQWDRPEFLRDHLHFLVLPREGDHITPRDDWSVTLIHADHPASSSAIRQAIAKGANDDGWIGWLHPAILKYSRTHNLYKS